MSIKKAVTFEYELERSRGVDLISVIHADDCRTELIELVITQRGERLDMTGRQITARFAEKNENVLIADNVACTVSESGNILVPYDNAVFTARKGDLSVEISIKDGNDILTLPYPLWIRVNGSILDNAQIDDRTRGTIWECFQQTDAAMEKLSDTTVKNRAEVLGGVIAPEMERGYISSANGGEYRSDNRYIRTCEGFDMWLNPGAIIALTDYSDARLTVKYKLPDGTFKVSDELNDDFTVKDYGFYRFLVSKAPVGGALPQLTDTDAEALKALVRVTNPAVYSNTEASAPAPLILGRGNSDATYVDFTAGNGAVTMTIPGNSGIVTTNGIINLGNNRLTVNCVQNGYERVKVIYDKNSGTVKAVPHTDNAFSYILIAAVSCYLDPSLPYYKVPAEVHINAPYRINNRCMGLPFSEVLAPVAVGYDPGAKRNYVSVDTINKKIIFPKGTLIFAGETGGFINLNDGAQYVLDYSSIPLGSGTYYGVMKLYFNINSKQLLIAPRNSIMYGCYPLVAVVHVPQSTSDKTKPSISINAPAVIDHLPNGFDDQLRVKNPLIGQISHRGYNYEAPENTLPAFKLARKMGFTAVETDIQRTADGKYICFHDGAISNRVAQNTGNLSIPVDIASISLEQAKEYDVGKIRETVSSEYQGTKIPTLEEALTLCRSIGLKMYIELKEETLFTGVSETNRQIYVNEIVKIVKTCGMIDHVFWLSLSPELLKNVTTVCPSATLLYVAEAVDTRVLEQAVALKRSANKVVLNVNIANCQKATSNIERITELCANNDIGMCAWFANGDGASYIANAHPYVSAFICNQLLAGNTLYDNAFE